MIRIYKLSTFDAFTKEERRLNDLYKNKSKEKAFYKKKRDEEISKFKGTRKIERSKLFYYDYDENGIIIQNSERENTDKQIALFESEMARYATDFKEKNPLVIEIVYLKISNQLEIMRQIIDRGLDIGDTHYIFYSSTTNQMKRGEIILVEENFYNKNIYKFMCGLTDDIINSKGGCNSGKYLAYKGLPLSTSVCLEDYIIDIDRCLVVPDFETAIVEKVECVNHDDNEITGLEVKKEEIKIPQTDGAGMFLPGVLPATAQIRCSHLKGCIFPFDFRKFIGLDNVEGVKPSPIIVDVWGAEHDVIKENIEVIFTASQLKMWRYYDSWDSFKESFKNSGMNIAINKFADTSPKGFVKSSYQFIQTLSSEKLNDEMIVKLCKDTIDYLNKFKMDVDMLVDIISNEHITACLKAYPELIQDKYIQSKAEKKFQSERTDARGNKLILKDSLYSYICPDLFGFCEWLFCGIKNPKGIIPRNCVYNSFYNDKEYKVVDCLRSPHLYMEHGLRYLVQGESLELCKEWFAGYDTVVSGHDLLCRILQFDVDGDEILLTPNENLITCIPEGKNTLYYKSFDAEKCIISDNTIYQALVSSMKNSNIGDISNTMTKNYNNEIIDDDFNKVLCCFNNLTIDFPKTQKNISLGCYEEKYEQLKNEKPPYFFRYAKGKSPKNCKEPSNSNCDRICRYIHKKTGNKQYQWKNDKPFNPSILFNQRINVDIHSTEYDSLEKLMFQLKQKERLIEGNIDKAIQQLNKSDAAEEKISKYLVFYDMCEKMILKLFKGNRVMAAEYLLDFEYLQRNNESSGKNILWSCFGDVIYDNICRNKKLPTIRNRRNHYTAEMAGKIKNIERITANQIAEQSEKEKSIIIYKEELEWIDNLSYRKRCSTDRELLFILLALYKRNEGLFIYKNKKYSLTCSQIDKWLGVGTCTARKGITRLCKLGAIEMEKFSKGMKILVNVPQASSLTKAYEILSAEKNPLISFYEYNGEKVISKCSICNNKFIKYGKQKTCPGSICGRELELRRKRKEAI